MTWGRPRSRDDDLLAEAMRPKSCTACGRTFGSLTAWTVHFEAGPGSACLGPGARGQLEERDGVWVLAGSATAG